MGSAPKNNMCPSPEVGGGGGYKKKNICGVVYEIPCHNCEMKYRGETGIQHKTE